MKIILYNVILIIFISLINCCPGDDDGLENTYCTEEAEVVEEVSFDNATTLTYDIHSVRIDNDCIMIVYETNICDHDSIEEQLISTNNFYDMYPLHRDVKLIVSGNEDCTENLIREASFNLIPFQLEGYSTIPLNIIGWTEPIEYNY